MLLVSCAFGILTFLLPIYSKRVGGGALATGGLFSVFSAVSLLLRPLIGSVIDRYGG